MQREELLLPQVIPPLFEGGVVAEARFVIGTDGIKVVADLDKVKKRAL
jgi:hypothetical protein